MYKRLPRLVATALIATLGGWIAAMPAAQAWDVSYDFTASGEFARYRGCDEPEMLGQEEIAGSVTFKVLTVAPPANAEDYGTHVQSWSKDWVLAEFSGETSQGPLGPLPFDSTSPAEGLRYLYGVAREPDTAAGHSQAALKQYLKVDYDQNHVYYRDTFLNRFSYEEPWFSGLNFDPGRSPEYNYLYRGDYYIDYSSYPCPEGSYAEGYHPAWGTNGLFAFWADEPDAWVVASLDLAPLADKLAALPGGRGLSVLISTVQAQYDAGDMAGACQMLTAFSSQARGLAHNQNFAEMAGDALLDAELIGKILECN